MLFALMLVQQLMAKEIQTFLDFPPMQRGASFNLDAIKVEMRRRWKRRKRRGGGGGDQRERPRRRYFRDAVRRTGRSIAIYSLTLGRKPKPSSTRACGTVWWVEIVCRCSGRIRTRDKHPEGGRGDPELCNLSATTAGKSK